MIIVSTDGSCLDDPGGAIGWAWIAHEGGRFDSGGAASGTGQVADLTALLRAIEAHPGSEPLLVESDSQYAIRCASEWLEDWKRQGWRTATGGDVQHLDLVQAIDRAIAGREGPVRFRWVRGHVGDPFNERAEQLAGLAAQDWGAGRGGMDELLVSPADADGGTAPSGQAPTSAGAGSVRPRETVGARERGWELGTLFD